MLYRYFEKAAAKNSSEALYCLGAMYDNGQGGLPRNRTKALELFKLSAAQKVPWPAALQALGTFYMTSNTMVSVCGQGAEEETTLYSPCVDRVFWSFFS